MFLPLIRKRRSIRKYLKKSIDAQKIALLTEAALRAPSSRGIYPWQFIMVDQPALLEKLAESKGNSSAFLKNASLGIVICADPALSDAWIEDTAIAATYIQLAAESLGLASCWIQIRERKHDDTKTVEEFVRDVLEIAGHLKVSSIIAIGYSDEDLPAHSKDKLRYEKVFYNSYGSKKGNN
jgi:nitroreductase